MFMSEPKQMFLKLRGKPKIFQGKNVASEMIIYEENRISK